MTVIRDLGYSRYDGLRRSPATRWLVIMRHQIATAWKTWWRFKAALAFAVIVTFVWGGLMFAFSNRAFRGLGSMGQALLTFADAALPMSIEWYCRVGFYLSLTLGASVIAGDISGGAFTLYFSRSVRPRDYVLGKIAGYAVLVGAIMLIGPLVLAALRLGLCDSTADVIDHLWMFPKILAIGAIATIVYTVVPLGFSALFAQPRYALGAWAAYYLIFGSIMQLLGATSGGSIAAVDLPTAVLAITLQLFDVSPMFGRRASWQLSPTVAVVTIVVHVALAIAAIWYSVAKAQRTGVGGSS